MGFGHESVCFFHQASTFLQMKSSNIKAAILLLVLLQLAVVCLGENANVAE